MTEHLSFYASGCENPKKVEIVLKKFDPQPVATIPQLEKSLITKCPRINKEVEFVVNVCFGVPTHVTCANFGCSFNANNPERAS